MKKWLALMFVSAFVGSVASAQWLVYDFKASIKRADTKLEKVNYSVNVYDQKANTMAYLDTVTAVSDSLKGMLMVPICVGCNDNGVESSLEMPSWLYSVRKGDKTKSVWKFETAVSSGIFGKGVAGRFNENVEDELQGGPTSLKGLKEAWMSFSFAFATPDDSFISGPFGVDYVYGFLGIGSTDGALTQAGFGKVKIDTQSSVGVCGGSTSTACFMINTISGNLTGMSNWTYICGPAIWDICSLNSETPAGTLLDPSAASVNGSWSIKLNSKVSAQVNAASTDYAKEAIIVDKLGGGALIGDSASSD
jgi:hypothetical protein